MILEETVALYECVHAMLFHNGSQTIKKCCSSNLYISYVTISNIVQVRQSDVDDAALLFVVTPDPDILMFDIEQFVVVGKVIAVPF